MPRQRVNEEIPPLDIESMASAGEVMGVLAELKTDTFRYDKARAMSLLRRAMAASMTRDLGRAVEDAYALMIGFTVDMLILAQVPLMRQLDRIEREIPNGTAAYAGNALMDALPAVERLHNHLIALTKALGTCKHTSGIPSRRPVSNGPAIRLVQDTEDLSREMDNSARREVAHG